MDSYTNIDLKELLTSAALEDEELAVKLDKEGEDKLTFQKIEWKADEKVGGFERELVGIYVQMLLAPDLEWHIIANCFKPSHTSSNNS